MVYGWIEIKRVNKLNIYLTYYLKYKYRKVKTVNPE